MYIHRDGSLIGRIVSRVARTVRRASADPATPDRHTAERRQARRDVTAGIIAICLGLLIITYGTGGDLELAGWVAVISAAFGSTANEIRRR